MKDQILKPILSHLVVLVTGIIISFIPLIVTSIFSPKQVNPNAQNAHSEFAIPFYRLENLIPVIFAGICLLATLIFLNFRIIYQIWSNSNSRRLNSINTLFLLLVDVSICILILKIS